MSKLAMGCSGSKDRELTSPQVAHNAPAFPTTTESPTMEQHNASGTEENQNNIRDEVINIAHNIHNDIAMGNELSVGEREYAALLKRWLKRHSHTEPTRPALQEGTESMKPALQASTEPMKPALQASTDPNSLPFPLPADAGCLRPWLQSWQPVQVDIGEDQSAWAVLPHDAIQNGFTTPNQQSILAARSKRRFLFHPERMRRRREELARYFTKIHRIKRDTLASYLGWANLMVNNQAELDQLCEQRQ